METTTQSLLGIRGCHLYSALIQHVSLKLTFESPPIIRPQVNYQQMRVRKWALEEIQSDEVNAPHLLHRLLCKLQPLFNNEKDLFSLLAFSCNQSWRPSRKDYQFGCRTEKKKKRKRKYHSDQNDQKHINIYTSSSILWVWAIWVVHMICTTKFLCQSWSIMPFCNNQFCSFVTFFHAQLVWLTIKKTSNL